MRIIGPTRVKQWARTFRDAEPALSTWLTIASAAEWENLSDVREDFPHADSVKVASGNSVTVFNICGNKYRLLTAIKYRWQTVYMLRFLTHAEYDKDKWKDQL